MKKSLLMILGAAAILLAGCAKDLSPDLSKLTDRVAQLEKQVEANKKAIEALQDANFISKVEETESGWSITLDNGDVITLYNGKDGAAGKDGDAFFKSVVVDEANGVVTFTLEDGTSFQIAFENEFELVLDTRELIVAPNSEVRVPFTVKGQTEKTEVYAVASGAYSARVEGPIVVINTPSEIIPNSILVAADNGAGKVSLKSINLEQNIVTISNPSASAYFWGGDVKFSITSNVDVEVISQEDWITVVSLKAATRKELTLNVKSSPKASTRTGKVLVKDTFDKTVQELTITQAGTKPLMIFNTGYDSFAQAVANYASNEDVIKNGYVDVAVSEGEINELLNIPDTDMPWVVRARYTAKPENVIIGGIRIANTKVDVRDVTVRPVVATKGTTDYMNYPYGILVDKNATKPVTVRNTILDMTNEVKAESGTLFYVASPVTSDITVENCYFNGLGARISQIYGGKVLFNNNTFKDGYSSYAIRIGATATGLTLTNNLVDTPVFVDIHSGLSVPATITFGEGGVDNNIYTETLTTKFKKGSENATVVDGESAENTVVLGEYKYPSIMVAMGFAKEGDTIELPAGHVYKENVKVNKNVTIKGADKTSVIAGNIEIASQCTIKDLTIRTEPGVTNNVLTLLPDKGEYYNWGHNYLCRVEFGAKDVLLENLDIVAEVANEDFKNAVSNVWISQASDITLRNCTIKADPAGAYCGNQTYDSSNIVFEGNAFVGGGQKGWAVRACGSSSLTLSLNSFNDMDYAVDVLNTFSGVLKLGDGEVDNNIYGAAIKEALHGNKDAQIALGAKFYPENMIFGQPTTEEKGVKTLWKVEDLNYLGVGDTRAFGYYNGSVLCAVTASPMVAVRNGALAESYKFDFEDAAGFTGKITGVTNIVNNGKTELLVGNVASLGNQWAAECLTFMVYHYTDANTVERVLSWTMEKDSAERIGDYISFSGTWQDGEILVSAANATGKNVYIFPVKDGVVTQTPTILPCSADILGKKNGTSGLYHYKGDEYIMTAEGNHPLVVRRTDSGMELVGEFDMSTPFGLSNNGKDVMRTPKFFTIDGKEYVAFLKSEYAGDFGSANSGNHIVCIMPLKSSLQETFIDAFDYDSILQVPLKNAAKSTGNGFAGLDIECTPTTCYIGYGARNGEIGVLSFRP